PGFVSSAAKAFPASMTLPPPIAITSSHRSARARAAAPRIKSTAGSPATSSGTDAISERARLARKDAARSLEAPVTTSARRPNAAAAGTASRTAPSPKMILRAVANSNMRLLPIGIGGKHVLVRRPAAGLGHHLRHSLGPKLVVRRGLVRRRRREVPIDFGEN